MRSEVVTVSPELARLYLEGNTENRNVRESRVKMLAEVITRGEWVTTHQGIAISSNGRLLDGQHRLLAIVKAGKSVDVMVTTGADESSFSAIDLHDKRRISDALCMPKHLTECAKFVLDFLAIKPVTTGDVQVVCEHIADDVEFIVTACNAKRKHFTSTPFRVAAVTQIRMDAKNRQQIANSYQRLALCHSEAFTPIEHSIYRQSAAGKMSNAGGAGRFLTFCRAFSVFDQSKRDETKIYVRSDMDEYRNAVFAHMLPQSIKDRLSGA